MIIGWAGLLQVIIQKNAFFLCKIRFRTHTFIIWGQKKQTKKSRKADRKVGRGGVVNTYGQPDRKYPFFGDFLSWVPKRKMSLEGAGLKEKHPKGFVTDPF